MDGPTHGGSAHSHPILCFPPGAVFLLAGFGMGFQQFLYAPLQGGFFSRRSSRNGSWQNIPCFASLLEVALDRRLRHLETFDDLSSGYPLINCAKNLLSHLLRICSHASI